MKSPNPNLTEASKDLAEEMKKNDIDTMGGFLTHSTHPRMPSDFERIIEKVMTKTPLADFERVEKAITIGPERNDRGTLTEALDKAEDNARIAHALYCTARFEQERWEIEQETVLASIRTRAVVALEEEKKSGLRTKQITDADVVSKMAALFPDEYRHAQTRAVQVKKMVEHTLKLCELSTNRAASLRVMLEKVR